MRILHVVTRAEWDGSGPELTISTRGKTLAQVGFIHACTRAQLPGVLQRFYSDVTEPMVTLGMEESELNRAGSPVRWEPAPDTGELFPHIYGPIPRALVREAVSVQMS